MTILYFPFMCVSHVFFRCENAMTDRESCSATYNLRIHIASVSDSGVILRAGPGIPACFFFLMTNTFFASHTIEVKSMRFTQFNQ